MTDGQNLLVNSSSSQRVDVRFSVFMIRAVAYAIKRRDVDMPSAKKKEGGGGWEMMEPPRSQTDMCAV